MLPLQLEPSPWQISFATVQILGSAVVVVVVVEVVVVVVVVVGAGVVGGMQTDSVPGEHVPGGRQRELPLE
jgi:hypothetical protein